MKTYYGTIVGSGPINPAPVSPDIRDRFQLLHREGLPAREISRRLRISAATAVRFADRLRQAGDLTPAANSRRRGHGRLMPYEGLFTELVEHAEGVAGRPFGNPWRADILVRH